MANATTYFLMSGHTSTGRLKPIDRKALESTDNRNVLVLNLTSEDRKKLKSKQEFFKGYFDELGAKGVAFIEEETSRDKVEEEFERAGLVYLPGGDAKTLIRNIQDKKLSPKLYCFNGVISGNSAGAYALCPNYIRIGHGPTEIIPATGTLEFHIKVHYKPEFDEELLRLSRDRRTREIIALEDESAFVWGSKIELIGNIWRFCDGKKEGNN